MREDISSLIVIKLYPPPAEELPLAGLYLAHDLRLRPGGDHPFFYSSYIASLDGRIAVASPDGRGLAVPKAIANDRDWRLFQELAAQADLILTSGRYLRDYAAGRAQEILYGDDPRFTDLRAWRLSHGLPPLPALAVISAGLDFPVPPALIAEGRRVLVVTGRSADRQRVRELENGGVQVLTAGDERVDGTELAAGLSRLGFQIVFNATGPQVLHMLLQAGVLDRLYLTIAGRLLGGATYATIVEGELLEPARDMKMEELYWDPEGLDRLGQLFSVYHQKNQI